MGLIVSILRHIAYYEIAFYKYQGPKSVLESP